jgi:hypothetical protein
LGIRQVGVDLPLGLLTRFGQGFEEILATKPCAWLTMPSHEFKDSPHRNRYWQTKPRKIKR